MNEQPKVTVIVATRNRPAELARCLESLVGLDYPQFEVVVSLQGDADKSLTEGARQRLGTRFSLVHVAGTGQSRSQNLAARLASGEYLAFTDDDTTVSSDWLNATIHELSRHPKAVAYFGPLIPVGHDRSQEFITEFRPQSVVELAGARGRLAFRGVGANMVISAAVFRSLGGFDECLGPGSCFKNAADYDFAHRALRLGHSVLQGNRGSVFHWSKRSYEGGEGRQLLRDYNFGSGGFLGLLLRNGDWVAGVVALSFAVRELGGVPRAMLTTGRPTGVLRFFALARGLRAGLAHRPPASRTCALPEWVTSSG